MGKELQKLDTPADLVLSDLERKIIDGLAGNRSPKDLSIDLGIPVNAIRNLMRKDGVSSFIQEIIDARNQLMKMRLPDLLMGIIEDKVLQNAEDEDKRIANLSSKDIVDIARQLNDLLKTTGSEKKDESEDAFIKIYQQINNIQNGDSNG